MILLLKMMIALLRGIEDDIVEGSREDDIIGCSDVDASDVVLGFSPEGEVALMS